MTSRSVFNNWVIFWNHSWGKRNLILNPYNLEFLLGHPRTEVHYFVNIGNFKVYMRKLGNIFPCFLESLCLESRIFYVKVLVLGEFLTKIKVSQS